MTRDLVCHTCLSSLLRGFSPAGLTTNQLNCTSPSRAAQYPRTATLLLMRPQRLLRSVFRACVLPSGRLFPASILYTCLVVVCPRPKPRSHPHTDGRFFMLAELGGFESTRLPQFVKRFLQRHRPRSALRSKKKKGGGEEKRRQKMNKEHSFLHHAIMINVKSGAAYPRPPSSCSMSPEAVDWTSAA